MKKIVPICAAVAAAAMMLSISTPAMAMGGPSGPHVTYPVQGNIGEVIVNPYKVAPLTAVIRDAGYDLSDVTVRIVPKTNGQEITYKVSRTELKTHAGIPVFGLYPDWQTLTLFRTIWLTRSQFPASLPTCLNLQQQRKQFRIRSTG